MKITHLFLSCNIVIALSFTACSEKSVKNNLLISKNDSLSVSNKSKNITYQDTVTNELRKQKQYLDNQFITKRNLPEFNEVTESGELQIGSFFDKDKYAILAYKNSDTTIFFTALKENKNQWDTVLVHQSPCYYSMFIPSDGVIELADFNGDNIPDLRIIHEYWDIHPGNCSLLWIFEQGTFQYIDGFDSIVSPYYDYKTNKIYSYQSDGCSDMNMDFKVYQIEKNKAIETKWVYCECCECQNGSCNIDGKPIPLRKVHLYIPDFYGEMIKTKIKYCQ